MTIAIPTIEPSQIVAGDLIQWTKTLPDTPATSWTLAYTFINSTTKFSVTATASGGDFAISIPAATSAAYTAGTYSWQSYVTNGLQRVTIASGTLVVKPNFATTATLDTRSSAKQTLDALDAEILARAQGGMTQEYTIGSRSLKKCTVAELVTLRDKYAAIYLREQNAENIAAGRAGKNRILVRF